VNADALLRAADVQVSDLELASGRAVMLREARCLFVETVASHEPPTRAARACEIALRELSSEQALMRAQLERGFRIEDLLLLELRAPESAWTALRAWWERRLLPETELRLVRSESVSVRALFAERGEVPTSQRKVYAKVDGRVRVEAFELHVTEHCNLRCAHCCNTSPYLPHKTLDPAHIADTLATMSAVLQADVFKIMGGEPLLHPQITEVLRVVRASGVASVVRLFTNGLLLSRMDDDFWRALDQLTVSTYASAPVRREHLALIEDKADRFGVVLNVKPVQHFSQVMHDVRRHDDAAVQKTWDSCWLRHRCLVARDGRFYICTRAAYLEDLHERVQLSEPFEDPRARRLADSVALDDPQLGDQLLALLNRSEPLHSCRFCLGGDGPRETHTQLSRDDVRQGLLRRRPMRSAG
jgi:organic radical activating enzyme